MFSSLQTIHSAALTSYFPRLEQRLRYGILLFYEFKASWILENNYLFSVQERTTVTVLKKRWLVAGEWVDAE